MSIDLVHDDVEKDLIKVRSPEPLSKPNTSSNIVNKSRILRSFLKQCVFLSITLNVIHGSLEYVISDWSMDSFHRL